MGCSVWELSLVGGVLWVWVCVWRVELVVHGSLPCPPGIDAASIGWRRCWVGFSSSCGCGLGPVRIAVSTGGSRTCASGSAYSRDTTCPVASASVALAVCGHPPPSSADPESVHARCRSPRMRAWVREPPLTGQHRRGVFPPGISCLSCGPMGSGSREGVGPTGGTSGFAGGSLRSDDAHRIFRGGSGVDLVILWFGAEPA